MNERMIRQQLANLGERVFQMEAEIAAMRGLLTIPASDDGPAPEKAAPARAEPKAPSIPRRTKGAKDG